MAARFSACWDQTGQGKPRFSAPLRGSSRPHGAGSESLDSIYTLTLGGPGYATFTMTYYIYTLGLRTFNLGLAAASSWLFMAFAAAALALVFWLQRRWQTLSSTPAAAVNDSK